MKNKIGFRKYFQLSIFRQNIFSFSYLYCVWRDNIFILIMWITWQYWSSCYAIFIFKFYRMNWMTLRNIKWHIFSCKVMHFSSQKILLHIHFSSHIILHIQWYGIPWRLKESWHVSRAGIDLAKCYLETHEGTGPCPWWHPDEFTQIKNGYFSLIRPPCASILSAFRTQFLITISPFKTQLLYKHLPLSLILS